MARVHDHRHVDTRSGHTPRRLYAPALALTICAVGAVHGSASHALATRHAPAVTATRLNEGIDVRTLSNARSQGSAVRLTAPATNPRPPRGLAPQEAAPAVPDGYASISGPLEADAYGVNVDPLSTCLSCTSARAGRDSSAAEGREFRIAGESVCEGQVPANGYGNGTLVAAPSNGMVRLAVAEWDGYTVAKRGASQAHARGALLDFAFGDAGLTTVTLGESTSDANYRDSRSHARSENNAARVGLGGGRLALVVLHSEGSSDAPGHAYLASINDEEVVPSHPATGDGRITVPRVTSVGLLHGDGSGGTVASASDGQAQRVVGVGAAWVGSPSADPQPLR